MESGATEESCCDGMFDVSCSILSRWNGYVGTSHLARRQRDSFSSVLVWLCVFDRLLPPHLDVTRRVDKPWYHAAAIQARQPVMCHCRRILRYSQGYGTVGLHAKADGMSWHSLRHPRRVDGIEGGGMNGDAAQRGLQRRHTLYAAVYVARHILREAVMAWRQEAQPYLGNRPRACEQRSAGGLDQYRETTTFSRLHQSAADSELSRVVAILCFLFAHLHPNTLATV
jgi:hypothetical protein